MTIQLMRFPVTAREYSPPSLAHLTTLRVAFWAALILNLATLGATLCVLIQEAAQ